MPKFGQVLCFGSVAVDVNFVMLIKQRNLDRNLALQFCVESFVHDAKTAASQEASDFISAEPRRKIDGVFGNRFFRGVRILGHRVLKRLSGGPNAAKQRDPFPTLTLAERQTDHPVAVLLRFDGCPE